MCSPFKQAADSRGYYELSEPASSDDIIYMAKCLLNRRFRRGTALSNPAMSRDYLHARLAAYEYEVFAALFLDNRHRVITFEEMFKGTIDGATVHPREVVKAALSHNAAAVIFAHNHPSGVAEPSSADQNITKRLTQALSMVDIRVLDHFVIGDDETVSFAERGLLYLFRFYVGSI